MTRITALPWFYFTHIFQEKEKHTMKEKYALLDCSYKHIVFQSCMYSAGVTLCHL